MENKISYGLKNVYYAPFTVAAGVITYETPKAMPGGTEISLEPRGDMTEFYADDVLYYSASNNQGYDGTLTIANIPEQFAIDALGEEKDSIDMVMTEKSSSIGKAFALMFEFDGDVKATRHVLYNCTASRPKVGSSTKTNTAEPNTNELTFVSSPRETDYAVKTKTTTTTPVEIYSNWYTKVYEKVTTPLTATVTPLDEATGVAISSNIVWTFDKVINEGNVNVGNFIILNSTGAEVAGTLTLDKTKKIVTFNPTSDLTNNTAYTAIVLATVRGADGSVMAANSITNFTTAV